MQFYSPRRKFGRASSNVAESDDATFDEAECALPPSAFLEAALLRWARLLDRRLHQVRKQVIKAREIENLARQSQRFVLPGEMELTERARQWLGEEAKVGSPSFVSLHACLGASRTIMPIINYPSDSTKM